jgi:hypothetical protein
MAVVMVVTTMLVVMMMVVVIVSFVMTMAVIMMAVAIVATMIVRRVAMRLIRRVRVILAGIGAALGVERRFDLDHPRAKPLHHRLDDVVAPDPQSAPRDLRRQMAVAKMPGETNQMLRVVTSDFQQRLRRGYDFDQPVILQHQRIAAA